MKKIIIGTIILFVLAILVFFLTYITLENTLDNEMMDSPKFDEITFEFSGKSENFSFDTGKVYLEGNERRIYISDFKQNKKISDLKKELVYVYFEDEIWQTRENNSNLNKLNSSLESLSFYEGGQVCVECEQSALDNVTEEDFKEKIKIIIEYCTSKSCKKEKFKLKYVS